jgi:hypothetical protein
MEETIEPVFDFTITDWEYLAIVCAEVTTPIGEIDYLSLIYKDGHLKIKSRIRFPSGNKLVFEKDEVESLNEAIKFLKDTAEEFPGQSSIRTVIVYNSSTKGKDLIELMEKHPNIELTCTEMLP